MTPRLEALALAATCLRLSRELCMLLESQDEWPADRGYGHNRTFCEDLEQAFNEIALAVHYATIGPNREMADDTECDCPGCRSKGGAP